MSDIEKRADFEKEINIAEERFLSDLCDELEIRDEGGTINRFEFHNTDQGIEGLRRSQLREAILSARCETEVITYLVYPDSVEEPVSEMRGWLNTYRVRVAVLPGDDLKPVFRELQQKLEEGGRQEEVKKFLIDHLAK